LEIAEEEFKIHDDFFDDLPADMFDSHKKKRDIQSDCIPTDVKIRSKFR